MTTFRSNPKMNLLIIDGDVIVYLFAATAEEKGYNVIRDGHIDAYFHYKKDADAHARAYGGEVEFTQTLLEEEAFIYARIDEHILTLLDNYAARDNYEIYLGGPDNFRTEIYPEYKAKRQQKPIMYQKVRDHLVDNWGAIVINGMEADDAIGIAACCEEERTPIICTVDKDLDTIPGIHFNPRTLTEHYVTPDEAIFNLYVQILTGDSVDNIPGCKGIGTKTAQKILTPVYENSVLLEQDLWRAVVDEYEKRHNVSREEALDMANLTASLVYILQEPGDEWRYRDYV